MVLLRGAVRALGGEVALVVELTRALPLSPTRLGIDPYARKRSKRLRFSDHRNGAEDLWSCLRMANESAREWAVEEFGRAELEDGRWRSRLISMGGQAASRPGGRVSAVFPNAAERQGAYGLLENRDVTSAHIANAMFAADARRCRDLPFVFAIIDGSSVTLTDSAGTKDFGWIGSRNQRVRGLKVISSLLVSPDGVPCGLGAQVWWVRTGDAVKGRHQGRTTGEKETRHWLTAIGETGTLMARHAQGTRCWFQIDREGDAWPIITEADRCDRWFTIRGNHNRRVKMPDGSTEYLRDVIGRQPVAFNYGLAVSAGQNRSARQARMAMRTCRMTLDFRDKRTGRRTAKIVNVVLAREEATTPAGEKPIEWLLLTNHPSSETEEMAQVVLGYAQRWRIEDFHRTWKSGACDVENMQLRSRSAVEKWATLLAAVAVRIERLKLLARTEPARLATDEFTEVELRAIALVRFGTSAGQHLIAAPTPTIAQAVQWLAEIGGYTGKSSGGPPGSVTIGRGLKDVIVVARALAAQDAL